MLCVARRRSACVCRLFSSQPIAATTPPPTSSPIPLDQTRGPGGRSSVSGITATVFGSYGFVGRYFMNELGKCGSRVYAPFRGDELEVRESKQMFDHGQLGLLPFSARDEDSIRDSLRSSDVVINLIGKHYETKHIVPTRRANGRLSRVNYSFEEVHCEIPQTLARLSREAGVRSFIHMSASSADPDSSSAWNRSKAHGEVAVRNEFPEAIIVKPNSIFGPEDRFLNMFGVAAQVARCFPLVYNGETLVQPVHVGDVGRAMMEIVWNRHDFAGSDFHLAGPDVYSYKELAELVMDIAYLDRPLISIPTPIASVLGEMADVLINPMFIADDIQRLASNNVLQLTEEEKAKKPKRNITRIWGRDERMEKIATAVAAAEAFYGGDAPPSLISEEEATEAIMKENKGHRFTFEDLNIEPSSVETTSYDFLRRFRRGGKFNDIPGYKK